MNDVARYRAVILPSRLNLIPSTRQGQEPILVQALGSKSAVEGHGKCVRNLAEMWGMRYNLSMVMLGGYL
jgi:hypothetical protein